MGGLGFFRWFRVCGLGSELVLEVLGFRAFGFSGLGAEGFRGKGS